MEEVAERRGARPLAFLGDSQRRARILTFAAFALILLVLIVFEGLHDVLQTSINGLSLGAIYALGAVGLTLVYGILKLVNFAQGDMLAFGGYIAYLANVTWGLPFAVAAILAMVFVALIGVVYERGLLGPMRERGAGILQLLLISIGVAFILRAIITFIRSTNFKQLDVNRTGTKEILGLSIGDTQLMVIVVGVSVLVAVGLLLRYTLLGKRMRALSDNLDLAETSGINTRQVILITWIFAGALAGLAGVMAGAITDLKPEYGFALLLPIFAAVVLGGIGDAFGALFGGLLLGVVIELSTLVIDPKWKVTIGFAVLILVLIIRPQGLLGKARTV